MAEESSLETINIQLPNGPIIAKIENDLIIARGVKYANQKRFAPPCELESWTDPIDCTNPGPSCPQVSMPFEPLGDMIDIERPRDEDCLRVNIVAPFSALKKESGEKLPVMVWIHGGAYIVGTADLSLFDTRGLARRNLVMVSIQYRLGIFGYAAIKDVAPPNLGLMDQIAALRWVQNNVANFGGDPDRVTIFGQSAGGDAVYSLLLAEGTDNLFHQAIVISAPFGVFQAQSKKDVILEQTLKRMAGAKDLHGLTTDELLDIQRETLNIQREKGVGAPGFFLEAGALPLPASAVAVRARLQKVASRVRVMIGWTKDDALPFVYMAPPAVRVSKLPVVGSPLMFLIGRIATRVIFSNGSKAFHKQYLADGGSSNIFQVEYFPKGAKFRASHCMETPFLFGGYEEWSKTPLLQGVDPKIYQDLSREMKTLFETFARGDPMPTEDVIVKEGYSFRAKAVKA